MIQGGDPTGTGTGGPGYRFDDEPVSRQYLRGTLAMANAGPNTNGSQFFLISGPSGVQLPPAYALFGQVVKGLEIVDEMQKVLFIFIACVAFITFDATQIFGGYGFMRGYLVERRAK